MSRRRLYVPITRSGSSILASVLTQVFRAVRQDLKEDPGWDKLKWHLLAIWLGGSAIITAIIMYNQ